MKQQTFKELARLSIVIKLQVEGLHRWPECNIDEVKYLRDLHRHIFYIKCVRLVEHADRDVEIIKLKHRITKHLHDAYYSEHYRCHNFDRMSCEGIALMLCRDFELCSCEVLEDNENGAEVLI